MMFLTRCFVVLLAAVFLAGCQIGYKRENGRWAWVSYNEGVGRQVDYVKGADDGSFEAIPGSEYARDAKRVYLRSLPLEGADPKTFVRVKAEFWRDARSVYWNEHRIEGADAASFRVLAHDLWALDRDSAYHATTRIAGVDVATFRLLNEYWARDSRRVYSTRGAVPCDPATFVLLNENYAKDAQKVFWRDYELKGADAASFVAETKWLGHDRTGRYSSWSRLPPTPEAK